MLGTVRLALMAGMGLCALAQTRIPIVVAAGAAPPERVAAQELSVNLARLYRDCVFPIVAAAPREGPAVLVGAVPRPKTPDSFVVTRKGDRILLTGANPRGTLYGAWALLEKLGFGFYLSYETAPEPRKGPPKFQEWETADSPTFGDRIIFNWHNFLSSSSTWELEDWQRWVIGAARMRYNAVMVHAYGNNPMFRFTHNGQTKEVGYLATTVRGRDWGTEHVNDVRRLIGGELFRGPVFGSSAALVEEGKRSDAKTQLMRQVFTFARERGLGVTFALDVDTASANPQNILATLPERALIRSGKLLLANPDTPEGYEYYKTQARQLFEVYPQIDRLAVWFRNNRTPWRDVEPKDFPASWRAQFEMILAGKPALRNDKEAHGMFAMAKLVSAFQRALKELGRNDVELAYGSWRLHWLAASDVFMPRGVKVIPLDWETVFETPKAQEIFRGIVNRPAVPIVWAHHDDRTYIGRPYTPYQDFSALLASSRSSSGFGIIHWTTRPLDLYFKSLGRQVWKRSENELLAATCERMAADTFGPEAHAAGGRYLADWATTAPMFGRETSDRFIDVPLKDAPQVIEGAKRRLGVLRAVDRSRLPAAGREWLDYFRDFEEFVAAFFSSHSAWERAQALHKKGEPAAARRELSAAKPEDAIRQYVRMSSHGRISRGEEAIVISLNLRWLPYFVSLRQALGMEPVRLKFQPTQHEPLAQGAGTKTFFLDSTGNFWGAFGEKETSIRVSPFTSEDETCRSGLQVSETVPLRIQPIMGDSLTPGRYRATLRTAFGQAEIAGGELLNVGAQAPVLGLRPLGGPAGVCTVELEPVR